MERGFGMIKSVQQLQESGIRKLEEAVEKFMKNPKDMASFVYGIRDEVIAFGLSIIKETLEDCNQMLRDNGKRREEWTVVKTDHKKLLTSLGTVEFEKTLFQNKHSGERAYLLDRIMGIGSCERLTEDAEARLLEEAAGSSYRKAGEEVSLTEQVSRQTAKNKLHSLSFPRYSAKDTPAEKKVVDYLYIDADEDHVPLQFKEKKGDLEKGENNWKNNCVLAKLVYVYEGVEPEAPKSRRHRLINPHYFSGVYDGDANNVLWDEIYEYLESHYDLDQVKKIYLNADGGAWIQSGKKRIAGITSVLDEFHLRKYVLKLTAHLKDSAEDARKELCVAIKDGTKESFREIVECIKGCTDDEKTQKRIEDSAAYIQSNWTAAKTRFASRQTVTGSSTEGHVSHVLSSRMSSRPMSWSRPGADKMARLRAYHWNGGNMLELVRSQKRRTLEESPENEPLSSSYMLNWERSHASSLGKYVESMSHSVSVEVKKYMWFNGQIWGL